MLPEECIGLLIEDLNGNSFSVTHHGTMSKSFVSSSKRGGEFRKATKPSFKVFFRESRQGRRSLANLRGKDGHIYKFAQEKLIDCEIRIMAREERQGKNKINPRLVTEEMLKLALKRVTRHWRDILVQYGAFLGRDELFKDTDLTPYAQSEHMSYRLLKVPLTHEEIWQAVEDDHEPAGKITRVDFYTDVSGTTSDTIIVRSESHG